MEAPMPFLSELHDPATLKLMKRALGEATLQTRCFNGNAEADAELRIVMVNRITAAVARGERDPNALKLAAMVGDYGGPRSGLSDTGAAAVSRR
jgi:hypothetical protein